MKPKVIEPKFDTNFSPEHQQNKDAARARGLTYDRKKQCYVDEDGCVRRDRFGQPC
jgi:hypothetical protein